MTLKINPFYYSDILSVLKETIKEFSNLIRILNFTFKQGKFTNSAYWFNQMYYGSNSAFKRSQTGRTLSYSSNVLTIKGFMEGNTYHAVLNISVTPRR